MKPQNIYFDGIFLLSSNSASLYSKPNIANAYVVNRHVNWKTKQYLLGKMMKFMLIWWYLSKTCWWVSTAFTKKYWHIWWWFSSDFCFSFIFWSKKVVNFRIFVVTYLGGMEGVEVELVGGGQYLGLRQKTLPGMLQSGSPWEGRTQITCRLVLNERMVLFMGKSSPTKTLGASGYDYWIFTQNSWDFYTTTFWRMRSEDYSFSG